MLLLLLRIEPYNMENNITPLSTCIPFVSVERENLISLCSGCADETPLKCMSHEHFLKQVPVMCNRAPQVPVSAFNTVSISESGVQLGPEFSH
jgi:hypothetical protein